MELHSRCKHRRAPDIALTNKHPAKVSAALFAGLFSGNPPNHISTGGPKRALPAIPASVVGDGLCPPTRLYATRKSFLDRVAPLQNCSSYGALKTPSGVKKAARAAASPAS